MTAAEYETRRFDTHTLLGAAAHLLRMQGVGGGDGIIPQMTKEWLEGYKRFQDGQRPAVPFLPTTHEALLEHDEV